jgi:hypothetical protein
MNQTRSNTMKFNSFIFGCFLLFNQCIQKQNPFEDKSFLLSTVATQASGTPKSFGLDILVNSRLARGCETRLGNLAADVNAYKANATIGFYNGGNIRDEQGIKTIYPTGIIPKGTVPTVELIRKFIPFTGGLVRINMQAFRIKQALEAAAGRLNVKSERNTDDLDSDGATHGNCWLNPLLGGSGRFFQVSSKMQIELNPSATSTVASGTGASNTLLITTEGKRVTRIILDGILLYNNTTGDITSGWSNSTASCTIKGVTFTTSSACNFYSVGIPKFQFDGGDSNPVLNPSMLEINNDGSVILLESGIAASIDDATIFYDYIQTFTAGPVFPKISNRIIMP